jgi:hypothetical protein
MSLNLLNGNSEALMLLDWFQLTGDIASLAHFESTKSRLLSPPIFKDADLIQRDLNRLEFFIKNYDDFSVLFSSKLRMLPDGAEFFSLIPDLFKGKFFQASELNFFCLLIEAYSENFGHLREIEFEDEVVSVLVTFILLLLVVIAVVIVLELRFDVDIIDENRM